MLQFILYFIGFLIYSVSSDAICRSDPKNLMMCMRPLLDTWEHIRNEESHASNLLIPVPFYTKPSIFALCNSYVNAKEKCFEGDCADNMMLSFVKGQLGFVCGINLPLYIENYDCLTSSLLKSRQCLQSVYGMPNPLNSTGQCTGLPKFFNCTASSLEKSCGRTAVALLNGVIEQLGCDNDQGHQYKLDLKKINESGQLTDETLKDYLKRESPKNLKELMTSKENTTDSAPLPNEPGTSAKTIFREAQKGSLTNTEEKQPPKQVKLEFEEKTVDKKEAVQKSDEIPKMMEVPSPTAATAVETITTTIAIVPDITVTDATSVTTVDDVANNNKSLIETKNVEESTKTSIPEPTESTTKLVNVPEEKPTEQTTGDPGTTRIFFEDRVHIVTVTPEVLLTEHDTNKTEDLKLIVHRENAVTTTIQIDDKPEETQITTELPMKEPQLPKTQNVTVIESMLNKASKHGTENVKQNLATEKPPLPETQDVKKPETIDVTKPPPIEKTTEQASTTKTPVIDFEKPMEDPKIEPLDEVLKHFKLSSLTKKTDSEKEIDKKEAVPDAIDARNTTTASESTKSEHIENPAITNSTLISKDNADEFKSGYENRKKLHFSTPVTPKTTDVPVLEKPNFKVDDSSKELKQREISEVVDEPIIEPKVSPAIPEVTSTEKATTLATTSKPETTTAEPVTEPTTLATLPKTTRKTTTTIEISTTPQQTSTEAVKREPEPTSTPFVRLSQRKSATEELSNPRDPKDPKCTDEDVEYISACHEKLMRSISDFSALPTSNIRFPLFNLTSTEIVGVCKVYDQGVRCSEAQNERCRDSHILTFLNTQLESLCFRIYSMKFDYDCMRKTYLENIECIEKITGSAESADKCTGQQESFDCFVENSGCGDGVLILIKEMLRGYGCRVDTKPWLTKAPTTTTRRMRKTRTTTPMPSPANETSEDTLSDGLKKIGKKVETSTLAHEFTSGTTIDDLVEANKELLETDAPSGPSIELVERKSVRNRSVKDESKPIVIEQPTVKEEVTEPQMMFHSQCDGEERNKARVCVAPLLKSLILLRKWRPELTEMRFPIYKYTRGELLDLCDGYANAFLCAGHGPIRHCLKDELISFAQDHLGYQCSPQNIGRFMQHYDCIVNVEMPGPCAQFVKGEAVPGTTKVEKCNGIGAYRICMLPLIRKSCAAGATSEFEQTIMQFGC